jgi:hypothetical protein
MPVAVYPRPNTQRRAAGGGGGVGAPPAPPRVRFWPFEVQAGSQNVSVAVSERFQGPAILDSIQGFLSTAGSVGDMRVDVLVSNDNSGTREDSTNLARPNGVSILDQAVYSDAGVSDTTQGTSLTIIGSPNANTVREWKIGRPITESEFFLKVYLRATFGANSSFYGTMRVIEGLFLDEIANFL